MFTRTPRFTFIEVLLIVAILGILVCIVIMAINPHKQFAAARDAQRLSDVYSILNALHQYALDNEGVFPYTVTIEEGEICASENETCEGLVDLSVLTLNQHYLASIPMDPQCPITEANCSVNGTGYFISLTENGRVKVTSYGAEDREISVTR